MKATSLFDDKNYNEASKRPRGICTSKDASASLPYICTIRPQLGHLDKAIGFLQRSLKKDPDDPNKLYHLSLLYVEKGETAKAEDLIEKGLDQDSKMTNC
ncbi:tetratricopeptide repeat protein [Bacillus sp. SL00103]